MERFNRSVRHDWLIHSLSESIPQSRRLQRDGSGPAIMNAQHGPSRHHPEAKAGPCSMTYPSEAP
ncbi:MAG: hypothetical protein FHP94_20205 [Denitromonas halophila]|nr:MAG: hypothetical protein FHP94_20205 [Denitromonas halophila]TVT68041.1 MAG: hypothetical protein FHP93_16395 [Denitromonas halophila]